MDAVERDDVQHALVQGWSIAVEPSEALTEHALLQALADRVRYLLRHDYSRLLSGLYLLDVSEQRFVAAQTKDEAETAQNVARLILDREIEKAASRRRYARPASEDSPKPIEDA